MSLYLRDKRRSSQVSRRNDSNGIVLFDSVHFVLAAEKILKRKGIWIDLVPVPRVLSADCGMAISFRSEDLAVLHGALTDATYRAIYVRTDDGYEEVAL